MNPKRRNDFLTSTGEPDNLRRKAIAFLYSKGATANGCFFKHRRWKTPKCILKTPSGDCCRIYIREGKGHQEKCGGNDSFSVQWSGENSSPTFYRKVSIIQMSAQIKLASVRRPFSHVRHASLSKPVNKRTAITKHHGANRNRRKLIHNRGEK